MSAKMSLGNKIRAFFHKISKLEITLCPSGLFQARKKLDPGLYKHLRKFLVEKFYAEGKEEVKKWNDKLVYAVDVSVMNLPTSEETKAFFSEQTNASSTVRIQAYGSFLYDVLNELVINAELEPKQSETNFVFNSHRDYYSKDTIILYDRGYSNYALIALHSDMDVPCVIRCSTSQSFGIVSNFAASDQFDSTLELSVTRDQKECVTEHHLPEFVKIRLIKVILSTGEIEVLLTTLLDSQTYPVDYFHWLYHQRWCIETYFDRLKNQLEVERFTSGLLLHIEQDFYSRIFITVLESILTKDEQSILTQQCLEKKTRYMYKINKSISYAQIHDDIIDLLLNTNVPIEDTYAKMRKAFKIAPSPVRPDKSKPRLKTSPNYKLWHQKYRKKSCF